MASVIRACCPAGAERKQGYLEAADGTVSGFGYTSAPGPALGEVEHCIDERIAWHEAAHAVVGFVAGWPIETISIVPPERVVFTTRNADREPWLRMVSALAGGAGEDSRVGWFLDERTDSILDYIDRAFNFCGGQCDGCKAAMSAWQIVGVASTRDAAADQWRAAELEARRLCTRPDVRAAIVELVAALMASPTMTGSAAETIIKKHVRFGELAEKGNNNACSNS